jgi:Ca2+/Na+ antiporter
MRNSLWLLVLASFVTIPFLSIAQIRYAIDSSTMNWVWILALLTVPFLFYVYKHGKSINDEYDRKYQLMGTKGGESEKGEESEEDDLMEYEKMEEKTYRNDKDSEDNLKV